MTLTTRIYLYAHDDGCIANQIAGLDECSVVIGFVSNSFQYCVNMNTCVCIWMCVLCMFVCVCRWTSIVL